MRIGWCNIVPDPSDSNYTISDYIHCYPYGEQTEEEIEKEVFKVAPDAKLDKSYLGWFYGIISARTRGWQEERAEEDKKFVPLIKDKGAIFHNGKIYFDGRDEWMSAEQVWRHITNAGEEDPMPWE